MRAPAVFLTVVMVVGACAEGAPEGGLGPGGVVRVGVLPDQDRRAVESRHGPLIRYLADATGQEFDLQHYDSYDAVSQAFLEGEVDLAWFGGLTFVRAQHVGDAEPLVMRDIDNRFASHFIVRADAPGSAVEDFEGARMAFGAMLSTSGHLMPRYFLGRRGINVEAFFESVRNTRAHDETARMVRDGVADIGAVNSVILAAMVEDGRLEPDELRVLEVTPTYANYVWSVHEDLDVGVKRALRDAFLALDLVDPAHRDILDRQGAGAFMPSSAGEFSATRLAALELGLLEVQP